MLEYGWGNPAPILLSGEDDPRVTDQANQMLEPFNQNLLPPVAAFPFPHHHHHHHQQQFQHQQQNQTFLDPRPKVSLNPSSAHADFSQHAPFPSNSTRSDFQAQIGLNLGVRTYFSSTNENFASRLYRGPRPANPPRCQADGCTSDFTSAKQYHKKHKVCDFHSKAPTVIKNGLTQRFCQQCSRFHLLPEFDQGKRSCRRRLADHNRRRRKSQSQDQYQLEKHRVSLLPDENTSYRSSSESGTPSSSSVSVAVSPPRIALDCLHFTQGSLLGSSSNSSLSWGKENLQLFQRQTTDKEG